MSATVTNPPYLLHRPRRYADESMMGYMLRLAETNGYDSPFWITGLAGLPRNFVVAPSDMRGLAELLRTDREALEAACSWPVASSRPKEHRFFAGSIHRSAISALRPKICPSCLAEAPYLCAVWDLGVVTACPAHGAKLLDACPNCGAALAWARPGLSRCGACGHDLRDAETEQAPDGVRRMSRLFAAKAGLLRLTPEDLAALPLPVAEQSLSDAAIAALFLGSHQTGSASGVGHRLCARFNAAQLTDVFAGAAQVLADWPKGFYALLETIRARSEKRATGVGLEREFGAFYHTLYTKMPEPGFDLLRQEFERYVAEFWDGGFTSGKNARMSSAAARSNRYATRAEAAKLLNMRPETVSRLIEAGHLTGMTRQMAGRTLQLIERTGIEAFRAAGEDLIDLGEAGGLLGLSKAPVRRLLAAKLLQPVQGPTIDGQRQWRFRREDVTGLLRAVLGNAPIIQDPGPDGLLPLEAVLRRISFYGLDASDLLNEILGGRMAVQGRNPSQHGLAQALFSATELEALISRRAAPKRGDLTIPQAAERLGIKQQVAYHLVRTGLLPSLLATENGRPIRRVSEQSVEEFTRTYVSATELAFDRRTSPRQIHVQLAEAGIGPVTGPMVDGGRQVFYRRNIVEPC